MTGGEFGRRALHASGAVVPGLYLAHVLDWAGVQAIAMAVTASVLALEAVRLYAGDGLPGYAALDRTVYRRLIRPYEEDNPAGYALYVLGGTVAAFAFRPAVAVPAFLMLAIADPVSGYLARNEFGQPKRPAVLAVTFALCLAIAAPFVAVPAAVAGAAVATAADGFTPALWGYVVDDNLGIPVGAGAAMAAMTWLLA